MNAQQLANAVDTDALAPDALILVPALGVIKPWIALTDKERAEELSALLGVAVAVDRFAIGYWCCWAHTKHPKNPRYAAHGMEANAYRGWLQAKADIKSGKD